MRDKIYKLLKVLNECVSCEECPLYYYCEDDDIICSYLENLDNKLLEEEK